jgi:hypothetical protein
MAWTEEQIDELIANVRRDFVLERAKPEFWLKLQNRGISRRPELKTCFVADGGLDYLKRIRF